MGISLSRKNFGVEVFDAACRLQNEQTVKMHMINKLFNAELARYLSLCVLRSQAITMLLRQKNSQREGTKSQLWHDLTEPIVVLCHSNSLRDIVFLGSIIDYYLHQRLPLRSLATAENAPRSNTTYGMSVTLPAFMSTSEIDSVRQYVYLKEAAFPLLGALIWLTIRFCPRSCVTGGCAVDTKMTLITRNSCDAMFIFKHRFF